MHVAHTLLAIRMIKGMGKVMIAMALALTLTANGKVNEKACLDNTDANSAFTGLFDPADLRFRHVTFSASHALPGRAMLRFGTRRNWTRGGVWHDMIAEGEYGYPHGRFATVALNVTVLDGETTYMASTTLQSDHLVTISVASLKVGTGCSATRFKASVRLVESDTGRSVWLAPDGDDHEFVFQPCCTPLCDTIDHTLCTESGHCLASEHHVIDDAECPNTDQVCCLLDAQTPSNGTSATDVSAGALAIYGTFSIFCVVLLVGVMSYMEYRRRRGYGEGEDGLLRLN